MSDDVPDYREIEHRALVECAERVLADPDSPPEHVQGAVARLSSGYVDVQAWIHSLAEHDREAFWELDRVLQRIAKVHGVKPSR